MYKRQVMGSGAGGMDIEEVAAKHPEQIIKEFFHPHEGLQLSLIHISEPTRPY